MIIGEGRGDQLDAMTLLTEILRFCLKGRSHDEIWLRFPIDRGIIDRALSFLTHTGFLAWIEGRYYTTSAGEELLKLPDADEW